MQVEPRVRRQPRFHVGVFVGGVVVQDQMHGKPFGDLPVDGAQELERTPRAGAGAGTARSPTR